MASLTASSANTTRVGAPPSAAAIPEAPTTKRAMVQGRNQRSSRRTAPHHGCRDDRCKRNQLTAVAAKARAAPIAATARCPVRAGPRAAAVAKKRTMVSGVSHAGRPGTTYSRADAYTPAAPASAAGTVAAGSITATAANPAYTDSASTSRLSHEQRRLRRAL